MKNLIFIALFVVLSASAQDARWGVKAGYNSTEIRVEAEGVSVTEDASGFYIGIYNEFSLSEKFSIQPELQYVNVSDSGENSGFLVLPVLAKYYASEKFSLLAGPQFDYLLDEDSDGLKKLGIGLAAGLAFDVTDNLMVDARYSFGLSNRLEDDNVEGFDVSAKFNFLQFGLGYRF